VLFNVKPWDDETDMYAMLAAVKSVEMDSLVWGASKLVQWATASINSRSCVYDEKTSLDKLLKVYSLLRF
jgi:elongation factor 1-beta